MPAVIFDNWKNHTANMVNPYALLTNALTAFYTEPNRANHAVISGIYARVRLAEIVDGDAFTANMEESMRTVLVSFNPTLFDSLHKDIRNINALTVAANIPDDPRYGIFTLTKAAGDEIFVSKKRQAPGLLVR
jgi:hypothetical protein